MDNGEARQQSQLSYRFFLFVGHSQRYFANDASFQEDGPLFVYVGGDYEIGTYWLEHGHMHDIAADLGGFIIGCEMRFYGKNRPTSDVSTSNLRFLSTEQVLADMANLIDHVKLLDGRLANAKVILVGTMFGGNLATWFRVKYPHHADGIWSSSSYVEARMNFREYLEVIGDDLRTFGNDTCYRRVWRAFRTIENLIDGGRSTVLDEMFHLCHPINVADRFEVARFFEAITESVTTGVLNGGFVYVQGMCEKVTDADITNDLIAFAEWFAADNRSPNCFGWNFDELVDFFSPTSWSDSGVVTGRRQFLYLTCTEYGWFVTTDSHRQPFSSRIGEDYHEEICRRVFGDWIIEDMRVNIEKTNINLGGSLPDIAHAFFTNGGMDPHRVVNVLNDIGLSVEARLLPRESH
jgi:thymus-specific serine protease